MRRRGRGLGYNDHGESTVPASLSNVIAIAAGEFQSLALRSDGKVVSWGWSAAGQTTVPADLSGVIAIAAGNYERLALKSDATVVAWGAGGGPTSLYDVIAIAAGGDHSLALKSDGTVAVWGSNTYGTTNVPAGLHGVIGLAAGDSHSLALKSDGTVVAWGYNLFGQCAVPAGLRGVIAVAAGGNYSLALVAEPPSLLTSAATQTAEIGSTVRFQVYPSGYSPLLPVVLQRNESPQRRHELRSGIGGCGVFSNGQLHGCHHQYFWGGNQCASHAERNSASRAEDGSGTHVNGPAGKRFEPGGYGHPWPRRELGRLGQCGADQYTSMVFRSLYPTAAATVLPCLAARSHERGSSPGPPHGAGVTLTGAVGKAVRVDYINQFGPTDAWVTLDTVILTNTTQLYFDVSAIGQPPRLWRIVPVP